MRVVSKVLRRTKEINLRVASVREGSHRCERRNPLLTESSDITEKAERSAAPTITCESGKDALSNCAGPTCENSRIRSHAQSLYKGLRTDRTSDWS